jgi:hypothetical protein
MTSHNTKGCAQDLGDLNDAIKELELGLELSMMSVGDHGARSRPGSAVPPPVYNDLLFGHAPAGGSGRTSARNNASPTLSELNASLIEYESRFTAQGCDTHAGAGAGACVGAGVVSKMSPTLSELNCSLEECQDIGTSHALLQQNTPDTGHQGDDRSVGVNAVDGGGVEGKTSPTLSELNRSLADFETIENNLPFTPESLPAEHTVNSTTKDEGEAPPLWTPTSSPIVATPHHERAPNGTRGSARAMQLSFDNLDLDVTQGATEAETEAWLEGVDDSREDETRVLYRVNVTQDIGPASRRCTGSTTSNTSTGNTTQLIAEPNATRVLNLSASTTSPIRRKSSTIAADLVLVRCSVSCVGASCMLSDPTPAGWKPPAGCMQFKTCLAPKSDMLTCCDPTCCDHIYHRTALPSSPSPSPSPTRIHARAVHTLGSGGQM